MRVAITGANGLLGGEAVAQAAGAHEVLAIGRGPCRLPPGRYAWASADLADGRSLEAALLAFRPEAVLHAGAATDVDGCEREPALAWRTNVGGTEQAARACAALGRAAGGGLHRLRLRRRGRPLRRGRPAQPARRLRPEQALRRGGGAAARARLRGGPGGGGLQRPARAPRSTFATQVVEKLTRGEPVKAFSDQLVSTTLAASGAACASSCCSRPATAGCSTSRDATVVDRVELRQAGGRPLRPLRPDHPGQDRRGEAAGPAAPARRAQGGPGHRAAAPPAALARRGARAASTRSG